MVERLQHAMFDQPMVFLEYPLKEKTRVYIIAINISFPYHSTLVMGIIFLINHSECR